ncbi:MAG: metallophosphoesterase family protein [Caldilineaceae bacterium]|nr:metallophosphoesterase family protein [Caldilineaceae bacterium]
MTKIALLSDTHDNIWALDKALAAIRAYDAEMLLHCGDLVAPFIIGRLAEGFPGEVHIVFGNNDGDGRLLQTQATQHPRIHLHGIYHELTAGHGDRTRAVAMIHYPEPARRIAQSGQFDLVCYGHDHIRHVERIGDCLLVNPGEVMGMKGDATWGAYDCATGEFEHRKIDR